MQNIEEINREIQRFMKLTPQPEPQPSNTLPWSSTPPILKPTTPPQIPTSSTDLINFLEKTLARNKDLEDELRQLRIDIYTLNEYKQETQQAEKELTDLKEMNKKNLQEIKTLKTKTDEMIKQRDQFINKEKSMEEEIQFFSKQIMEKERENKNLEKMISEQKNSKKTIKSKFLEVEKIVKLCQRKLNEKQNAVNYLNSELNKFINNEKKMSLKFEGLIEKTNYFERLYESMERQNDFLVQKLKQIGGEDVKKLLNENKLKKEEIMNFKETQVPSIIFTNENSLTDLKEEKNKLENETEKLKKKLKTKNFETKNLKQEIESLKNKFMLLSKELENRKEFNTKQTKENNLIIDNLMKKMEGLLEENLKYQTQIYKSPVLLKEEAEIKNDSFFADPSFDATKEAIKVQNIRNEDFAIETKILNSQISKPIESTFTDNLFKFFRDNKLKEEKIDEMPFYFKETPKIIKPPKTSQNPSKITKEAAKGIRKIINENSFSQKEYKEFEESDLINPQNLSNSKVLTAEEQKELKKVLKKNKPKKGKLIKQPSYNLNKQPSYNLKDLSINTFDIPTSESMKKIKEKTKKLDKKFEDLNAKLNKIRDSNISNDLLEEQTKEGNIHYSNIELNDEDFL